MSIEKSNEVDFIGTCKETGNIALAISDHLEWKNKQEHLLLLQDKINYYLAFIESGEILEAYPDAKGKSISINIIAKYAPPQDVKIFYEEIEKLLNASNYEFRLDIIGSN